MTKVRPRSRAMAAAMVVALVLGACSNSGGNPSGTKAAKTTTSASRSTTEATPSPPSTLALPKGVDPTLVDVKDPVFTGLGDPRIDVLHYEVELRADPGKAQVQGVVKITLVARTNQPLDAFTLDLAGPQVTKATLDGQAARFHHEQNQVEIRPATPLEGEGSSQLEISYQGVPKPEEFPAGLASVGWQADQAGGWFSMGEPNGTSTWVPVNDHPSDKATWTITLNTPNGVTGVANGRLASSKSSGDRHLWRWVMDHPMVSYSVLAAVGDYRLVTRDGPDDIRITLAVANSFGTRLDRALDQMDEMISYFSGRFGPYPYKDAGAIVVNAPLGLALETSTRPLFGTEAAQSDQIWALAHELAHQWWGDAISIESWQDLWLNEGFATYSDWLYQDENDIQSIDDSIEYSGSPADLAVTSVDAATRFDTAVYQGGAVALHALRQQIGDQHFFELLRTWYRQNRDGNVNTNDFVALATKVSGINAEGWRRSWLDASPQPAQP